MDKTRNMETFMIKSPKGRECKIGVRTEYEFDELVMKGLKPFGYQWTIIHSKKGYKAPWNERVVWQTEVDSRTPEDVLDYLYDKYGAGETWGFLDEMAVRA